MYVSSSINNNFALFTCRANKNQSVCPITIRDFRSGGFFCPIHHSSLISVPLPTRPTINTHTTRNDGCYFLHLRRHGSARAHVRASLGYVRGRVLESAPMTGASQTHHIVRARLRPRKARPGRTSILGRLVLGFTTHGECEVAGFLMRRGVRVVFRRRSCGETHVQKLDATAARGFRAPCRHPRTRSSSRRA